MLSLTAKTGITLTKNSNPARDLLLDAILIRIADFQAEM
jgi:hypothetical protein